MRVVFNLSVSTKILFDSNLIKTQLSCGPTTKYGIDMENNNIGIYRKTCKFKQNEDNWKTLKCLYLCKPNKISNKPKIGLKWHDKIEELPPNWCFEINTIKLIEDDG